MKRISICTIAILSCVSFLCMTSCKSNSVNSETNEATLQEAAIMNIMTRTSIRSFTNQPVDSATVETLLRAGMAAPTAMNMQPWHFYVVQSAAALSALSDANPHAKMLKEAPLAIVVCGDLTRTREGKAQEFWIQDCSAATENILLAAHAKGLGAVWTAVYPIEERLQPVADALKLPATHIPLCTIAIGYPNEQPDPKDKWNADNVSYL